MPGTGTGMTLPRSPQTPRYDHLCRAGAMCRRSEPQRSAGVAADRPPREERVLAGPLIPLPRDAIRAVPRESSSLPKRCPPATPPCTAPPTSALPPAIRGFVPSWHGLLIRFVRFARDETATTTFAMFAWYSKALAACRPKSWPTGCGRLVQSREVFRVWVRRLGGGRRRDRRQRARWRYRRSGRRA